jgi:hypothetical protein
MLENDRCVLYCFIRLYGRISIFKTENKYFYIYNSMNLGVTPSSVLYSDFPTHWCLGPGSLIIGNDVNWEKMGKSNKCISLDVQ